MTEQLALRFPDGTRERIRALAHPGETMTNVILRALVCLSAHGEDRTTGQRPTDPDRCACGPCGGPGRQAINDPATAQQRQPRPTGCTGARATATGDRRQLPTDRQHAEPGRHPDPFRAWAVATWHHW